MNVQEEANRVVAYRLRCAMEDKAKLDAQVNSEPNNHDVSIIHTHLLLFLLRYDFYE